MKLIDITREMFTAPVYPGDPVPELEAVCRMELGDPCNTSVYHGCVHNGTHMDAPCHFLPDEVDIAAVPLEACVGECSVIEWDGPLLGDQAENLVKFSHPRVLFKGNVEITPSAAFVLSDSRLLLVGVEPQSVAGAADTPAVHRQMLMGGVILLEGLNLSEVKPGSYFLFAAPIKLGGSDGAPVRAVLVDKRR